MDKIKNYLAKVNETKKALSIYLTAGYPNKVNFEELVLRTFDAGADVIELGIPFSDPLADGRTIQSSSQIALDNGITSEYALEIAAKVKEKTDKLLIIMTYANLILNYKTEKFQKDAFEAGIDGLIIPDLPLEESQLFFRNKTDYLDIILLTTPASTEKRIRQIDQASEGFLYCVSVLGTTGARKDFSNSVLNNIERTYELISNNKMLVGFGISSPQDIQRISPFCDGVIVGSAIIASLSNDNSNYSSTKEYIRQLNKATF